MKTNKECSSEAVIDRCSHSANSTRLLLRITTLLLLFSLPSATSALSLQYSYPTSGDYNRVELTCKETFEAVSGATFYLSRGGTEPEERIVGEDEDGTIVYTLSPANEGLFRCKFNGETSDSVPLAAQPAQSYDCTSDDPVSLDYQMREFSPDDRYTFNCTIRPGVMRSSYTLEWRSRRGTNSAIRHTDVDTRSFAVHLTASDLAVLYREVKLLECRVDIQHAPDKDDTYCGRGIRAAVKANISQHLPPTTKTQPNTSFNLTCTASGNELNFTWTYGNNKYTSTDDCRSDGICVHEITSPETPLKKTSVLAVGGAMAVAGSETDVRCTVTQNLSDRFRAETLVSRGTVTVAEGDELDSDVIDKDGDTDEYNEEVTSPTTSSSSETPSTNDVGTTPPNPTPLLNGLHITLIILVVPVTIIVLVGLFLLYHYKRRTRCGAKCENEEIAGDGYSTTSAMSPYNQPLVSMSSDESDGSFDSSLLPEFLQLFHNAASRFLTLVLPSSFQSWLSTSDPRQPSGPLRGLFNNRATNQLYHAVNHRTRQVRSKRCQKDQTCTIFSIVHELILKNTRTGAVKKICWTQPTPDLTPSPPHSGDSVSTATTPLSSLEDCATSSSPCDFTAVSIETTPTIKGHSSPPDYMSVTMEATNPMFDGDQSEPQQTTQTTPDLQDQHDEGDHTQTTQDQH